MKIKTISFVKSSPGIQDCPQTSIPEYAFIGRSNVGKSSLINMLSNRNKLALVSSKPGKTRLINHYLIDDSWHLVDLPGYGYASTSKKVRQDFFAMISDYIVARKQLVNLFVLVDSRLKPQLMDINFINKLGELGVPFSIIFTKIDKLSAKRTEENIHNFGQALLETWEELPLIFQASSIQYTGKEEILDYIDSLNQNLKNKI